MERLLLVDGYSIINRAFYGIRNLSDRDGVPTNAVYGFLAILFKTLDMKEFTHLAVAFDVKQPTFRHKMYDAYKGNRKPMPEELTVQVPIVKDMLKAMNIPCMELPGYEADDLLGTMARRGEAAGMEVFVLSGDRDLLQIATEKTTIVLPKTVGGKTETFLYNEAGVKELYGVTPTAFIDMKALMGDSSDNIPGLPGVGEKTAGTLIATYGSIENCMAHVDEIKGAKAKAAFMEHFDLAVLSKKLATIDTNAPIDLQPETLVRTSFATPAAMELLHKYHLKTFIQRLQAETEEAPEAFALPTVTVVHDFPKAIDLVEAAVKKASERPMAVQVMGGQNAIWGLGIALKPDELYYIPTEFFTNEDWMLESMARLLAVPCVMINARDALELLKGEQRFGEVCVRDLHVAAYLLDPLSSKYDVVEIAYHALGISLKSREEIFGKTQPDPNTEDGQKKILEYVAEALYTASSACDVLMQKLEEQGMTDLYQTVELPLIGALYRMEQRGIVAQKEELQAYGQRLAEGIAGKEKTIYEGAGETFNINSPKQLGEILFEKMQLPGGKKTKTGYSTSAEVLEKLSEDVPFVRDVLEYRQLTKLKSTYADALADYIGPDQRIHGRFHQTITATGRISSSDPNLQNIPVRMALGREIRKLFVPQEDWIFVDADYSQIELRILAHLSQDENLIKAYSGASDIHAATAAAVFHVAPEDVTPELRRKAKAVNFGIVYGISSFGLSEDLSISRKEATETIERYFESYPGVKKFLDDQVNLAKEKGYVRTLYGRIRPIPELKAPQYMTRMFGERVAMNSPIQGTAADIMKIAMIGTEKELLRRGLQSRIVLQVHDELLLECPAEEKEEVIQVLEACMKDAFDLRVPLEIAVSEGRTWYDTK